MSSHIKPAAISSVARKTRAHISGNWRIQVFYVFLVTVTSFGIAETVSHYNEQRYVRALSENVIKEAKAIDQVSIVVALRDYIRQNVSREGYAWRNRPLLRDSAADTLRSGKGTCGEATRAFINMADVLGIRAQRLYLEGRQRHVVALVTLDGGQQVLVDSDSKPYIGDLENLSQFSQHPEFSYYSSFNQHRLLIPLSHSTISLGPISYFLENPHALKALLCLVLAAGAIGLKLFRHPLRNLFQRRRNVGKSLAVPWEPASVSSGDVVD